MSFWQSLRQVFGENSGIGGTGDHSGARYIGRADIDPFTITQMLKHAPLIRLACEIMPEDICRAWRVHPEGADNWTLAEEQFDFIETCERALFYSEAFGGAFVLPRYGETAVTEKTLFEPFRQPRKGSLLGFRVFAPHSLKRASQYNSRSQPNGLPEVYAINQGQGEIKIHHTWFKAVHGAMAIEDTFSVAKGVSLQGALGLSKVDLIHDDFIAVISGNQALSHFLVKSNIDVLKLNGLAEALKKCNDQQEMHDVIFQKVSQASVAITGANAFQPMIIDSEESLDRKTTGNLNAHELIEYLLAIFVGATRIPRTRLLGEQAKGLGNAGEADMALYYDRCASMRNRRLTPLLNWMDSHVIANGGPAATMWEYDSLFDVSPKAQAEVDKLNSEIDKTYSDLDIPFIREKVAQRVSESGRYAFTPDQLKMIADMANDLEEAPQPDA